jgi:hypothetical protein
MRSHRREAQPLAIASNTPAAKPKAMHRHESECPESQLDAHFPSSSVKEERRREGEAAASRGVSRTVVKTHFARHSGPQASLKSLENRHLRKFCHMMLS